LTYEVEILKNFKWHEFTGKLYFSRYEDNNPGLILKTDDEKIVLECTIDIPAFYMEYKFGDHRIVIINEDVFTEGLLDSLINEGVVEKPLFHIETGNGNLPVCELTDQVIDLLKAYGEYYV